MPRYVDIHTHAYFDSYDDDRDEVVKRALDAGVWMLNVGTSLKDSKQALELAERYGEGVYATAGLHPTHACGARMSPPREEESFDSNLYRELLAHPRAVAVGECGLDYYRLDEGSKKAQQDAFEEQIALALELDKPLMLHIRDAYDDAAAILKGHPGARGNVHFFAGSWSDAKLFLDMGFTISFTGVITFTSDYDESVQKAPLDMIMAETDAPFVAPVPYRGKRNEPVYVREVAARIAALRGESQGEVEAALVENARRVFSL